MSGYSNKSGNDMFWNQGETYPASNNYYSDMQPQQLDFQSYSENQYYEPSPLEPSQSEFSNAFNTYTEFDEVPLLEELEIYPDRIVEKMLAVFNPFRGHSLADDSDYLVKDSDLAGPIGFCVLLAISLFLSGSRAHFGYIYGLSLASCVVMYFLLTLMTIANAIFTLSNVASILGYCLLPIVWLSIMGIFITFYGMVQIAVVTLAVIWSSLSASRLFCTMSGDIGQRPLIAYPCALVYGAFALLVIF